MDGNEEDLSARREGIGDILKPEQAGISRETPKGAKGINKRTLTSLVTPNGGNSDQAASKEKGEESGKTMYKKKKEKARKMTDKKSSSLGAMMQRMKDGKLPDESSVEETTDEEELEAYLAQWRDDEGYLDSETGWTDEEQNQYKEGGKNGQDGSDSGMMTDGGELSDEKTENMELDGNELGNKTRKNLTSWIERKKKRETKNTEMELEGNTPEKGKDYGSGNDFVRASSLRKVTNKDSDETINGPSRKDNINRRDLQNKENSDKNNREVRFEEGEEEDGNQEKTSKAKSLGIASGRNAKEMKMGTGALKIGPGLVNIPEVIAPTQKMYTYYIQLSFNQPLGEKGEVVKKGDYYVPSCFKQVVKQLQALSPAITLLPYNTNGIPITCADQLPDNEIDDYIIYYHNHQVTAGGQLTGMCCIEAPLTWYQLKDEKKSLFKWLREKRVFMKYVSFKADLVSAAGWFYGMNPDVLRKEEAKSELIKRLGSNLPEDLSFQMVPRMLSITDKITRNRFSFKGVAIECDRRRVKELQEILYGMESPAKAKFEYGITGGSLFVPFVENDVWRNEKILGMAKAHVQEMNKLGQIFLQNIQDIDQPLLWSDGDEEPLRTMIANCHTMDGHRMIHSIHNTNRVGTVTILYYKEYATEVNNTFPDIHEILERQLEEESKGKLVVDGKRIVMTGRQNNVGTEASKSYASYADIILAGMNPQGGDETEEETVIQSPPRKKQAQRRTPPRMTYSQITQTKKSKESTSEKKSKIGSPSSHTAGEDSDSENSTWVAPPKASDTLIDKLQERLDKIQEQFEQKFGHVEGTDVQTTNRIIEENNKKMQKISEEYFEQKFQELSVNLTKEIQKSNDLIFDKFAALNAQQNTALLSLQEAMQQELRQVYRNMVNLQAGKPLTNTVPQEIGIVARPGGSPQAGDGGK